MLRSGTRTFLLATCVIAAPALALAQSSTHQSQTQQSSQQHSSAQSGKFLSIPQSGQMRMADLRDADVYTDDNQKIGDIDDILLDHQGKIIAVVVGVGGFLGIGEKNVAIPFDSLVLQDKTAVSASNDRGSTRTSSTTTTTTTTDRNAANSNAASNNRAANANERAAERANERSAVNDRPASSNADRMATGNVPDSRDRAATDQDRQRTTAQRAEQMGNEQANRQTSTRDTTTTTGSSQRTAQATNILFKPERILLKGIAKADLQNAPEFHWDDSASRSSRSNSNNAPARNR